MSFTTGFVVFPNLTQLDFTGPLQVLHRLPGRDDAHRRQDARAGAVGLRSGHPADGRRSTTARRVDLLCVPGGFGVDQAMEDEETLAFVRRAGAHAKYVTSVLHGRLHARGGRPPAGQARGRRTGPITISCRAWARSRCTERVVRDGNTFTGGGVTAGVGLRVRRDERDRGPRGGAGGAARRSSTIRSRPSWADRPPAPRRRSRRPSIRRYAPRLAGVREESSTG